MLGANPAEGLTRKAFRKYETIMKSQVRAASTQKCR